MTEKQTSASRQSIQSMTATIPANDTTSPKMLTTPDVNSSLRASTSEVMRVITLPTGVRSVNRHGVTGLVVPAGDPDALADALNRLLENPILRMELGDNARLRVEKEFRAERMVSATLEVYREILRK